MITSARLKPTTRIATPGEHLIASVQGERAGPTLLIVGGIHGNEPAGVLAAERALENIKKRCELLRGEVLLLRGNTRALERNARYIDVDLNRQWKPDTSSSTSPKSDLKTLSELQEQDELLAYLRAAAGRARGEVYFLDLHTTSAHGEPFATVGDTLRNRRFALNFPLTIVLGLEEQIEGTLLEYMNNLGAITLGVEAGQHEAISSVDHHEAVIWCAIVAAGNLRKDEVSEFEHWQSLLKKAGGDTRFVEVRHRHGIVPEDNFQMLPGFQNFQPVSRGQVLATDQSGDIRARETGVILLPLYQKLGDDGFFLGRQVKRFWLSLSEFLRRLKVGRYVHLLPGVQRDPVNENFLIVNTHIARILPLQIFHLLGFRRLRWTDKYLLVSRRAYDLVGPTKLNF